MEKPKLFDAEDAESDDIPNSFTCCVCLELLYKPIVLPCGHISCFWCVHKSMNGIRESYCPICRSKYGHFPEICQMLHFLLLKIFPVPYKRREEQVLEEEKKTRYFSPQLDYNLFRSLFGEEYGHQSGAVESSSSDVEANLDKASTEGGESSSRSGQDCGQNRMDNVKVQSPQNFHDGNSQQVSIYDVWCLACKQLLFHPVVLNCGHVYCASCVSHPVDGVLKCQACQNPHPGGFPKACLEFDHFLQEQFPVEYALRREVVLENQVHLECENPASSTKTTKKGCQSSRGDHLPWWIDPELKVHVGVGCDSCGVSPIVGDRYKCQDCTEKIGFDLCGDCYNTGSKRPGRFNQQHTPEHKFKLDDSQTVQKFFTALMAEQSGDSVFLTDQGVVLELPEDESPTSGFSNDNNDENDEEDLAAPATTMECLEEQQKDD